MTNERDRSDEIVERELERYLTANRMTRRELLERVASLGAVVALAPIVAACSTAATPTPSPTSASATPAGPASAGPSATTAAASEAPATPAPTPEQDLYVYNWDAYIADSTVADFSKKYGIRVKYDKFPDEATQLAKIRSDGKGGGYDVTWPTSVEIPGLAKDGIIQPLNRGLITNMANLGAEWQNPSYDPNNVNSVPYFWWTTGYAWDPGKIQGDLTSWTTLWDPSIGGHLNMLDDVRECFAVAAFLLGFDPNTTDEAQLDQMLAKLEAQKPLVRSYDTDDIGQLTSGQVWVTHAWSGDYFQMLSDKPKTKFVIPSEGAIRGSDTMVVLSGAPHPVAANLWINYNLDPQVSANNSNFTGYMGPNQAAQQYIDPDILNDPAVNPAKATMDKLVELAQLGPDLQKYTDRWNQLKA
ncbi:MAG TPA: spermidine/putrescine ABC transporter substrate-binding protein [Candidatus Binatia bacterium]|nr:spermidine/putrescine ABC transporter substrate-binding protein [Candidatus Binatia bacterium]